MSEKYTNIRLVLDHILRHPLLQDISLETAVDYTVDFMRIVGVPSMFEEKVTNLELKNYRVELPEDYYQTIQVRTEKDEVLKYSSDSFHYVNKDDSILSYKIQGNFLYASIEKGTLEFSYEAIAVDEEGYPLIPDNSSFTRALEYYIKMKHFEILFDMGKIQPAIYQNVQQQYAWAVGDCATEFNRLSLDKAESFYDSWKELVTRDRHKEGFKVI